jgi:hypothetical protein
VRAAGLVPSIPAMIPVSPQLIQQQPHHHHPTLPQLQLHPPPNHQQLCSLVATEQEPRYTSFIEMDNYNFTILYR